MLRLEEEMFGDPGEIGICENCKSKIYVGQAMLHDEYTGVDFCSEDCLIENLQLVQVESDDDMAIKECLHCGEALTDEYESIMFKGDNHTRWCDLCCCMAYLDIHNIDY